MKAPLKTVLKNFLDHVEDLDSRRKVYDDQYELEFQELKKLTDKLKEDLAFSSSVGLKDVNRPKNRYKDIVPYDFSRVILPKHEGVPGSDYINASYIKGASGAFAYIAAQGPLPNTVIDFWRMIWVCDVQVIVMACNEKEAGKFKCEAYWPAPGEIKSFGNISIELIDTSQVCPDFLIRTFLVKCDSEMRDVFQFHYTSWPDHGVPDAVQPILDLVRLMRDRQASETVPIVVHCSAGCGRTGTICAVDYVWACLRHGKLDEDFSLYQIAQELRRQRIAMIQTKEQYILAHRAVAAMFEQQLKVIDCHIYENLDEDGEPLMWKEVEKDKDVCPDSLKISNTKEKTDSVLTTDFSLKKKNETIQDCHMDIVSHSSSVDNNLNSKANLPVHVNNSSKNSESSYSRNSILSQQSNEDSIPFIDDDDVLVRPNCGRAYLDIPSCDSISKLMNCFDPFVDRLSLGTEDSSPEGDPAEINTKLKDFHLSSSKTLDKNSKIYNFNYSASKHIDNKSDIVDISENVKKSSVYNYRESYPPSTENSQKCFPGADKKIDDSTEDLKVGKKVGKATVVRRPSISKLKALFEKSSVSSQKCPNDVSKRLLFRHNTHHVSRAGSAPPSLDCMDRSSAVERESILKIVTRKFRSSSVRTERELQSKQNDKTVNRKSATDTFKDGLCSLTRTVSFSLNKTFKSYSPSKLKTENISSPTTPTDSIIGIYKPKSPDSQKGNSMWYDKSSLTRAVAVVKPTGKFDSDSDATISPKSPSDQKSPDRKSQETHFNYITKPTKLKDFFNSLNKKDAKDATTLWYNEIDVDAPKDSEKIIDPNLKPDGATSPTKSTSKVLPFLQMSSWKKVSQKSPISSPDSPKIFNDTPAQQKSKFYTDVMHVNDGTLNLTVEMNPGPILPKCPVPEEIIPLNVNSGDNKFWPSNSLSSTTLETNKSNCNNTSSEECDEREPILKVESAEQTEKVECMKQQTSTDIVKANSSEKINVVQDVPPAIPKKLVIGKNKNPQISMLNNNTEILSALLQQTASSDSSTDDLTEIKPSAAPEKSDHYINVNIKAKKNIEQIENALRKNPRGAIIDLTSRESYSMEEELVNAVKQLSETPDKNKVPTTSSSESLSKNKGKTNSKFPGYEVIWPEDHCPIQKSKSGSKVPFINKTKTLDNFHQDYIQTGLCYSPPLRRSVNANLPVSKSQSCSNLDWLERHEQKEISNTPTKKLVNEAVVELNTLLNQLTTRTLSEDAGFNSNTKEKMDEETVKIKPKFERLSSIEQNDTVVDSVTLVTKSYNSGSSPKEEEIVFHFPPPPRVPPPKDETPAESFDIVCKGGSLVVKESSKNDAKFDNALNVVKKDKTGVPNEAFQANDSQRAASQMFPQPAPRKSKQANGLRKSSSYSNIGPFHGNIRYENIFLEKYQTLSKLEIKPEKECDVLDKTVPLQKSPVIPKKSSAKDFNYVNIGDAHFTGSSNLHSSKPAVYPGQSTSCKNEEASNVNISKIQVSQGTSKMIMDKTDCGDSVYGKIYKISDSKGSTREVSSDAKNAHLLQNFNDIKKKPVLSKKAERAPLPPNIQRSQILNNETLLKINSSDNYSMTPKKLPSRKLEKAPPPPNLLQKCSSAMNVPIKNLQSPQPYANFPATHQIDEKHKLPAVRENVPNDLDSPQRVIKKVNPPIISNKFINRGLSHSQSDVSVYLALKERRMQLANQERKVLNMESMLKNRKTNDPVVNVSSSDSDGSYERIFVVKNEESSKICSQPKAKEQIDQQIIKSFRKEVPIAPPRSKRRSTTDVQYSKVKAKDASHISSSLLTGGTEKTFQSNTASKEEYPPAIPMKTKDAFEIPEECIARDVNKTTEDKKVNTKPSK